MSFVMASLRIKITGELPDVTVDVSDYKLQELLKLALSIPVPESSKEPEPKFSRVSQFKKCTRNTSLQLYCSNQTKVYH